MTAHEDLGRLLREAAIPDEAGARDRALALTRAAAKTSTKAPRRPHRRPLRRLGLAAAALGAASVLVLTPAGAKVGGLVDDVVSGHDPAPPSLRKLPGGGRLLVQSADGPWVVGADGSQRLLGDYDTATWSPHGLFVAAAKADRLSAVEPNGDPHWTITAPGRVADPRWAPSGYRIAYRSGNDLRVVVADGSSDELLARDVAPVAPAWRPGDRNVLAYLDSLGRAHVVNADTGQELFRTGPDPSRRALAWSSDARRLALVSPTQVVQFNGRGGPAGDVPRPNAVRFIDATYRPGSHRLAVLSHTLSGDGFGVTYPDHRHILFSGPGPISGITWAPDGRRLLVSWRASDEWLFVPVAGTHRRTRAAGHISAQFSPGAMLPTYPSVEGWIGDR